MNDLTSSSLATALVLLGLFGGCPGCKTPDPVDSGAPDKVGAAAAKIYGLSDVMLRQVPTADAGRYVDVEIMVAPATGPARIQELMTYVKWDPSRLKLRGSIYQIGQTLTQGKSLPAGWYVNMPLNVRITGSNANGSWLDGDAIVYAAAPKVCTPWIIGEPVIIGTLHFQWVSTCDTTYVDVDNVNYTQSRGPFDVNPCGLSNRTRYRIGTWIKCPTAN